MCHQVLAARQRSDNIDRKPPDVQRPGSCSDE